MHTIRSACAAALVLVVASACARGPVTGPRPRDAIAPGVAHELARTRAATLRDVRYDIILDLTGDSRAHGRIAIGVERLPDAGDLVVDFRGPALDSLRVNGAPVTAPDWRTGHIVIPASMLAIGTNRIEARFEAAIAPAGASIIRYEDTSDGHSYLYTLLVPADANQLFPSFDQPDLKARVSLRAIVPENWRVLANGPERSRQALGDGRVQLAFAETRPISTYLIAFAAGPWTVIADTAVSPVPSSLWVRTSRIAEVDADTLLATNAWAREWLQEYFGTSFPFAKMDLLLAPAFPFGGMEHVGAIFYNENTFIFREPPTLVRRLGRDATIYHEVAHQWFGDLVTMRWFDDLWLKEGFATYMAAKLQAERRPESGAWKSFYMRNKPLAYGVDATSGTTPVWQALANLDLAKSNYGPIVYNKAPSILKQLEFMVGEEAFRSGVQRFLRDHAYANATWQELLAAIGDAAGMNLTPFGEHYMLRAGMPLVETSLTVEDGRIASLVLTQRPARALPDDPGGAWPMRLRVRLGYTERRDTTLDVVLDGERTEVTAAHGLPAPAYVFPNDGDHGYGLFLPDDASAAWLLTHAGTLADDLQRAMAWGALFDLVHARRIAPAAFAEQALGALPAELDEQIADQLASRAATAIERYLPPGAVAERLIAAYEDVMLDRAGDASLPYGMRRSALDAFLGFARTTRARAVLRAYLAEERHFDGEPLRQPSRWSALTRLLALRDPAASGLLADEIVRDTTPDAARQAFVAAAAVPTADNKASYFQRYLGDPDLNEEWVTASLGAFNDPLHPELVLPFLEPALERSVWLRDNRRIFFLPAWLNSFIGSHVDAEALRVVDAYLAAHPELPADVRRKILLPRDQLARTVNVRAGDRSAQD